MQELTPEQTPLPTPVPTQEPTPEPKPQPTADPMPQLTPPPSLDPKTEYFFSSLKGQERRVPSALLGLRAFGMEPSSTWYLENFSEW
jgi:hypothetical protein